MCFGDFSKVYIILGSGTISAGRGRCSLTLYPGGNLLKINLK
jgi:hypothetical protein